MYIPQFLQKQNIDLMKEAIDGTIHCKPGAAELLVQEIYTILTKRRWDHFKVTPSKFWCYLKGVRPVLSFGKDVGLNFNTTSV